MQEVVAQPAVDDVVGLLGREVAVLQAARIEVEGRQVDRLEDLADGNAVHHLARVDDRGQDVARRADHLVELVDLEDAIEQFRIVVRVARIGRRRTVAVDGGQFRVARREDPPVVADHPVQALAAGNPVRAPAADQVVALAVAEEHVGAHHAVGRVVARLAVDLVAGADVRRRTGGIEIGPAQGVVEQLHRADDDALRVAHRVVVERQEATRVHNAWNDGPVRSRHCARGHQPIDIGVVAGDDVGVAGMFVAQRDVALGVRRQGVVADLRARAAEDRIGTVGPQRRAVEAEQARAAADDVVLAQVAEDHVGAAVALDVVVAVARRVLGRRNIQSAPFGEEPWRQFDLSGVHPHRAGVGRQVVDRAVALDRVVAELTENLVVARAAGDVVVARRREELFPFVEQLDLPVDPGRHRTAVRVAVGQFLRIHQRIADIVAGRGQRVETLEEGRDVVAAVNDLAQERPEPRVVDVAEERAAPVEFDVVAEDQIAALVAIDPVAGSAADQDVLALGAAQRVAAADCAAGHATLGRIQVRIVGEGELGDGLFAGQDLTPAAEAVLSDQSAGRVEVLHDAEVAEDDVVRLAAGDVVGAEAAEQDLGQGRGRGIDRVVVARGGRETEQPEAREHVAAALGVEDEEPVALRVERYRDVVVAEAGAEHRRGALAGTLVGAVDVDGIAAGAGPDADAFVEIAVRAVRLKGDAALGQAGDEDLGAARQSEGRGPRKRVRDHHVGVADDGGLVADHQFVAAGARVDVEGAAQVVQVAGQEIEAGRTGVIEVGVGRHIDPLGRRRIAAAVEPEVGRRDGARGAEACAAGAGALDVEDVVARAEIDVDLLEAVVVDAVHAGGDRDRAGEVRRLGDQEADPRARRLAAVVGLVHDPPELALEPDHIGVAELADRDVVLELPDDVVGDGDLEGPAQGRRAGVVRDRRRGAGHRFAAGLVGDGQAEGAARRVHGEGLHVVDRGHRAAFGPCAHGDAGVRAGQAQVGREEAEIGQRAVRQVALEADHVDVVVLAHRHVAASDGRQALERRLHLGRGSIVVESGRRLAVEGEGELAVVRPQHDGLNFVRGGEAKAGQGGAGQHANHIVDIGAVVDVKHVGLVQTVGQTKVVRDQERDVLPAELAGEGDDIVAAVAKHAHVAQRGGREVPEQRGLQRRPDGLGIGPEVDRGGLGLFLPDLHRQDAQPGGVDGEVDVVDQVLDGAVLDAAAVRGVLVGAVGVGAAQDHLDAFAAHGHREGCIRAQDDAVEAARERHALRQQASGTAGARDEAELTGRVVAVEGDLDRLRGIGRHQLEALSQELQAEGAAGGVDVDPLDLVDRRDRAVLRRAVGHCGDGRLRHVAADREQALDHGDQAGLGDGDRVAAGAGVDEGMAADALHVDDVGPALGVDGDRAGEGRVDRQRVAALGQIDEGLLEPAGGDAAGQIEVADGRGRPHAEAAEVQANLAVEQYVGELGRVVGQAVRVVDEDRVDLVFLLDQEIGVEAVDDEAVALGRRDVPVAVHGEGDDRVEIVQGHEGGRDDRALLLVADGIDDAQDEVLEIRREVCDIAHPDVDRAGSCIFQGAGDVGLARQAQRVECQQVGDAAVDEAAIEEQRPPDAGGLIELVREDLGVATVDAGVVDRGDGHGLRNVPVVRREDQRGGQAAVQVDLLLEGHDLAARGARRLGVDHDGHVRRRLLAQHHAVGVADRDVVGDGELARLVGPVVGIPILVEQQHRLAVADDRPGLAGPGAAGDLDLLAGEILGAEIPGQEGADRRRRVAEGRLRIEQNRELAARVGEGCPGAGNHDGAREAARVAEDGPGLALARTVGDRDLLADQLGVAAVEAHAVDRRLEVSRRGRAEGRHDIEEGDPDCSEERSEGLELDHQLETREARLGVVEGPVDVVDDLVEFRDLVITGAVRLRVPGPVDDQNGGAARQDRTDLARPRAGGNLDRGAREVAVGEGANEHGAGIGCRGAGHQGLVGELDHVGRAVGLGDDHGGGVVVGDRRHHARGLSEVGEDAAHGGAHGVADIGVVEALGDLTLGSGHHDGLRHVPVARIEGQFGDLVAVGVEEEHLAFRSRLESEGHRHDLAGVRGHGQRDRVAVGGAALDHSGLAAALGDDHAGRVVVEDLGRHRGDRQAVEALDPVGAGLVRLGADVPRLEEGERGRRARLDEPRLADARTAGDLDRGAAQAVRCVRRLRE